MTPMCWKIADTGEIDDSSIAPLEDYIFNIGLNDSIQIIDLSVNEHDNDTLEIKFEKLSKILMYQCGKLEFKL